LRRSENDGAEIGTGKAICLKRKLRRSMRDTVSSRDSSLGRKKKLELLIKN